LLARVLRGIDPLIFKLSGGQTTLTGLLAGVPIVMVTSIGARTGLPRTSPLLPIRDPERPDRFALIASNWGQSGFPSWYFNLKKDPHATCVARGLAATYLAHEAYGEEYDRFWSYAIATYFGYELYKGRAGRRIPILVLTPHPV
jgi:deazaflavin-dependent oxidoreductase (nitroreductase family)